ncbi:MAG: OmpA family protein [Elusimicrobia bacterium]|nr:OmpA family protein [Elusimicrobiota bacterium]
MNHRSRLSALFLAAALLSACAGNRALRQTGSASNPAAGPASPQPTDAARAITAPEPDVRDMATRAVPELKVVRFAYDSARLGASAEATLKANAAWLKAHDDVRVEVSGNCDQRGTVAYNLALGQRRAASVRDYYKMLGVDPARVATISYGKERLLCRAADEACWKRNRRAETLQLVSASVAGQPTIR